MIVADFQKSRLERWFCFLMVIAIRLLRLFLRFLILSRFDSNYFLNNQVQKLLTIKIDSRWKGFSTEFWYSNGSRY